MKHSPLPNQAKTVVALLLLVLGGILFSWFQQSNNLLARQSPVKTISAPVRAVSATSEQYLPAYQSAIPSEKPTLQATRTGLPSTTPIPPIPTLSIKNEQALIRELQLQNCNLPCYLGIIPGKTSLTEAQGILRKLGGVVDGEPYIHPDSAIEFNYSAWIGDELSPLPTPEKDTSYEIGISHDITLITDGNVVKMIRVNVASIKSIKKLEQIWSRYTPQKIFLQAGLPNQAYIDQIPETRELARWGYYYLFIYEKLGARIEIDGVKDGELICPHFGGNFAHLDMYLYDPHSPVDLYAIPASNRDIWAPVEDLLIISSREFAQRVLNNPDVCFEQKVVSPTPP
jgi:hypothetical protein